MARTKSIHKRSASSQKQVKRILTRSGATIPRTVNFKKERDDQELLRCIGLGYSTRAILARTTLTPYQVMYRARILRNAGISRSSYRNGTGVVAQFLANHQGELDDALFAYLHEHMP